MRFVAPVALLMAGLLASASASASADNGAGPTASPLAEAPSLTAPPAAPMAPAYPAALSYAPGDPPPYWMPVAPPTERRSNALRTTGIVLFAAGGLATAVGGAFFAVFMTGCRPGDIMTSDAPQPGRSLEASRERVRSAHQALNSCRTAPALGLGFITGGVITAVMGIPFFVIGSKQVPARTTTGKLVPELRVGAANGSLRWSF